jgi:hypothetical protein
MNLIKNQNIMITEPIQSSQLSNNRLQVFKPNNSKLLKLTEEMINNGEVKTSIDFAYKFMFSLDSNDQFPINIELLIELNVYTRKQQIKDKLLKHFILDTDYQYKNSCLQSVNYII